MSTKPQWLVIVHDHPGTIQKRVEVRQQHLSVVSENQAVKAGGNLPLAHPATQIVCLIINRRFLLEGTDPRGSDAVCCADPPLPSIV